MRVARPLEETNAVVLGKIGRMAADLRRAESALGTNLRPNLHVRFDVEIRQAAIRGFLGPFGDALEFLASDDVNKLPDCCMALCNRRVQRIIRAALEHREIEFHRFRQRTQHGRQHRQIFFRELLLQLMVWVGDDGLFFSAPRRTKIAVESDGERFNRRPCRPRRRRCSPFCKGAGHGHGHFLAAAAELKILRLRQNARRRENFPDLFLPDQGPHRRGCDSMTLITVCEYADGLFPARTKNPDSRSRRRFVPPVGWEVHQGGFRPQATTGATLQLNDYGHLWYYECCKLSISWLIGPCLFRGRTDRITRKVAA